MLSGTAVRKEIREIIVRMIENQPQSPGQYPEFIALYKNFLEKLLSVNSDELRFSIQLMMC